MTKPESPMTIYLTDEELDRIAEIARPRLDVEWVRDLVRRELAKLRGGDRG